MNIMNNIQELSSNVKQCYENNKLHRTGGLPAIEWANGNKEDPNLL